MNVYAQKLQQVKAVVFNNQPQIDAVIAVRDYINTHYATDLNLKELSETQCISKFHLLRLFKKYYGQTPRQYLIDQRIKAAKKHLANGMSVTQTCYAVGFESPGSFSALFKTKVGKSPSLFRKEQLSRSM